MITYAQFRAVITKDYLSGIDAADLFSAGVIGKSYTFGMPGRLKTGDEKSPMMIEVDDSFRLMKWFFNSVLTNLIIAASGASLIQTIEREKKMVFSFKVIGFIPSKDKLGCPYYSKQVVDFGKLKAKYPGTFEDYSNKEISWEERALVNQFIRSHYSELFLDSMCTTPGVLNPDMVAKYQLGQLSVEVKEWMTE